MSIIDFYIIPEDTINAQWRFACRLLEKAYDLGHQVLVLTDNMTHASQFDDLLWTFRDISFIPHACIHNITDHPPFIQIGFDTNPSLHHDILLNISQTVPDFFTDFNRVIEIVTQEENQQKNSRHHYRHYQSMGLDIQTHDLRNKGL